MANIKLDLAAAPFDGQLVTFTAPCACDAVTEGLVINGETYTVCDGMGNCVTGSGGYWCSGAVVSVALDTVNKKAYLQNTTAIASNENLLDNAYFADPIDQRQGYIVPKGVNYYIPDSTQNFPLAGTTTESYVVTKIDSVGSAFITIDGTEYFVNNGEYVRGYTGGVGYGIDRWVYETGSSTKVAVELHEDCIRLVQESITETDKWQAMYQKIGDKAKAIAGRVITVSLLHRGIGESQLYLTKQDTANAFASKIFVNTTDWQVSTLTTTVPDDATDVCIRIYADITGSLGYTDMMAVKLELGDKQTLAHKDANGNWVLNDPPPNKALELLKCCMSTADSSDTYANNKLTSAAVNAVNKAGDTIHGSHTKPTGSYTGNGSTTSRTITTDGYGKAIVIFSATGVVLVTPSGGFYGYSNSSFGHFPSETAAFYNGVLTIASKHTALNTNGQTYQYQVL